MKDIVIIKKIEIIGGNTLLIKPDGESFEMIYRSATGVHWDTESECLSFAFPYNMCDYVQAFMHIVEAVQIEYGKFLKINVNTAFVNIEENVKNGIIRICGTL